MQPNYLDQGKKIRHANIEQMKIGKTYVSDLLDLVFPCVCVCVCVCVRVFMCLFPFTIKASPG